MDESGNGSFRHSGYGRFLVKWLAAVAVLALLGAACAPADEGTDGTAQEDEPAEGTDEEAEEIDLAAFCDALIEGEQLFTAGPELDEEGNPTPESLEQLRTDMEPLLEDIEQNTPEEVSSEVDTVLSGVRTALEEGDPASIESPEFFEADAALDEYAYGNCDLENKVDIAAVNYAFQDLPDEIDSGQVALRMDNQGEEVHEAVVLRIDDETDLSVEELLELPEEEGEELAEFKGVAFAAPGDQGYAVMDLEPGRYAFVCFIPVGTETLDQLFEAFAAEEEEAEGAEGEGEQGEDAGQEGEAGEEQEGPPPHFTQGMFAEVTVQ